MYKLVRYTTLVSSILLLALVTVVSISAQDEDGNGEYSYEFEYELVLSEEGENCALPIASLNGQGYSVSGVTGGLTTSPVAGRFARDPRGIFSSTTSVRSAVAILVIDEFDSQILGGYTILPSIFSITSDEDLGIVVESGDFPHGVQVFNHINALLDGSLSSQGYAPSLQVDKVVWSDGSNQVAVQMVDALHYGQAQLDPTVAVRDAVADAITQLASDGYTDFVLNMSFAVIPCEVVAHYQASQANFPSFEDYSLELELSGFSIDQLVSPFVPDTLQDLLGVCPPSTVEGIQMQAQTEVVDEEFYTGELAPVCEQGIGIWYVGSAGNLTMPYSFYPGALDGVISVSATQHRRRAGYSNYNADTSLIGGWFQLVDPQGINGGHGAADIFYRGTSFSGPVESVCIALNESSGPCVSFAFP